MTAGSSVMISEGHIYHKRSLGNAGIKCSTALPFNRWRARAISLGQKYHELYCCQQHHSFYALVLSNTPQPLPLAGRTNSMPLVS